MNRHVVVLEQCGDALNRVTHHRTTNMISVIVAGHDASNPHAVVLCNVDQLLHGICGVNNDALSSISIAQEIREIDHLCGHHVS